MMRNFVVFVLFLVLWSFCLIEGDLGALYFHPPILEVDSSSMDIPSGSILELNCTGKSPLLWRLPDKRDTDANDSRLSIYNMLDETQPINRYRTRLVFWNITYSESGSYSCYYEGTTDFDFTDNVTSVYIFVNDPSHLFVERSVKVHPLVLVQQNKRTTIACLPTNSKINVTLWKLETEKEGGERVATGMDILFDATQGFLLFYPTVYFSGAFQCRAVFNNKEQHINFTLVYFPDTLRKPQPFINTSEALHPVMNQTFMLKCAVEIDVGTRVLFEWSYPNKNNPRINETMPISRTRTSETTGFVHQVVTSNLIVNNATLSDSGDYRCSVTDHSKKMGQYNVTIVVYASRPPTHVNFSSDMDLSVPVVYQAGQNVKFIITVRAFPSMSDVELYWMKDGEPLLADSRYRRKSTGNSVKLEIEKLASSDAGVYTLVGKTSDTENNISIILDVKAKPTVFIENGEDFYMANEQYELKCVARSYPSNFILWWKWKPCDEIQNCGFGDLHQNWIDIEPRTNFPNREFIAFDDEMPKNGVRTRLFTSILHVVARRSGHYKCIASNIEGEDSQIIPFMVTDAADGFEVSVVNPEPVEEDRVVLTCRANTYNYSNVQWKWNNEKFPNLTNYDIVNSTSNYSHVSVITFRRILLQESGEYKCIASSDTNNTATEHKVTINVQKIMKPMLNNTNMRGWVVSVEPGSLKELFCYASGVPLPDISWRKDGLPFDVSNMSGVELTDRNQRLVVKRVLDKDSGVYECLIQNRGGRIKANVTLNVLAESKIYLKNTLTSSEIAIIIVFVIVGVILFILIFFLMQRIREERKQKDELTFLSQSAFEKGYVEILNPSLPLEEQIDLLPYKHQYEFPKERLKLGKTLGQGAFGRVVKGEAIGLLNGEASTTVAVKMLKETANHEQRKALIGELKILIHLGRHLNIVNLLGAITKNIRKGELMVMVEYCCFGNLRHYLLKNKGTYVDQLNPFTGELDSENNSDEVGDGAENLHYANIFGTGMDNPSYGRHVLQYADLMHHAIQADSGMDSSSLPPAPAPPELYSIDAAISARRARNVHRSEEPSGYRTVTTRDLLVYSFQCARGMEYLASKKLIHRDLAARNVLLATNNVVKICDFGLTKDGYNYVKKKNDGSLLPVKWLAIESIRHKVFTTKSDVWSFGILLWEIFTLGGNPYPGVEFNYDFIKKLEDGYRMDKPEHAPRSIYQMMKNCWVDDPAHRPDFSQLAEKIGLLLETGVRKFYVELNTPYMAMNEEYLNNNDYLQMCKQKKEVSYAKMNGHVEIGQKLPKNMYDNVPLTRPIDNRSVSNAPMENVPMIQFESPSHSQDTEGPRKMLKSFSLEGNLSQQPFDKGGGGGTYDDDVFPTKPHHRNGDVNRHHRYVNGFIKNVEDCEISTRC